MKKIHNRTLAVSYPWISSVSWGCNSSSLILCILFEMESTDLMMTLIFVCSFLTKT